MIIEGQFPVSLRETTANRNILFQLGKKHFDLLSVRMHHKDGSIRIVSLEPDHDQFLAYQGRYDTPECGGIITIRLKKPSEKVGILELFQGQLEIEHLQGKFVGNIELRFLASGIDVNSCKQWLIPTFNYNGNPYGKGKYPHPVLTKALGVRADRMAQPYILYQDKGCSCAVGLYSDGPSEGIIPGLPASLNWELSATDQSIVYGVMYPYWEYGHSQSESEAVYYKKNEFKPAERGILEWSGPTSFKLPFHIWFGGTCDNHAYATISWHVWQKAEIQRVKQVRPLQEEMADRIQFLNTAYYDSALGPGHYRCNMAYDYAASGFIWRSLEAAYLDWWLEAWRRPQKSGLVSNSDHNRGYRAILHWAQYGVVHDIIMTCYQGDHYCIRQEYGERALSTRVLTEIVGTFIRCYSLSEGIGRPEPLFRQVAEKQLDWLLQHRLSNNTFARYYLLSGVPTCPEIVATGTVITVLAEAGRIFNRLDYQQAAIGAYEAYRKEIIKKEAFYGGTLDADTEDKEAGYFGLEAAIALYRITGNLQYLNDAKQIADYILTYTWAYRIQTFPKDCLATVHQVDTLGATSVSPENQHFDPYNNTALILTGLFSGESQYTELGLAMLYFALDGRWSIPQGEHRGRKQPEQLLNTNWFYNVESVVRRGDYRDIQEEWAWPQVVPSLEYLNIGGACFDLQTGRGIGVDGCKMTTLEFSQARSIIRLQETMGYSHSILFKILNYPDNGITIATTQGYRKLSPSQAELGIKVDLDAYQDLQFTITR